MNKRPPHPATVAQPKPAFGRVPERPPHPATVVQPKPAFGAVAERPRNPATVGKAHPPHPATMVQPRPRFGGAAERPPHSAPPPPAIESQPEATPGGPTEKPPHPATVVQQRPAPPAIVVVPRLPAHLVSGRPPPPRLPLTSAPGGSGGASLPARRPGGVVDLSLPAGSVRSQTRIVLAAAQPMMDEDTDIGFKGFHRSTFKSSIPTYVTNQVNEELDDLGYSSVKRTDYDVAHKVSFEAIRNTIMSYIYKGGSTTYEKLKKRTEALYTQDKTRLERMRALRRELGGLVDHYGHLGKGDMLIIDAANKLLEELNSAPDNLGLGIPSENRSIGGAPDLVIDNWDKKKKEFTLSPRSEEIYDAWDMEDSMLLEQDGRPRSSQVTSFFNL
jgi:hypothetical protein